MKKRTAVLLLVLALTMTWLCVGCGNGSDDKVNALQLQQNKETDQSNARSLKSLVTVQYMTEEGIVDDTPDVYYLDSSGNDILTTTAGALRCEGYGDGYSNSINGDDIGYVWVYWDGTCVADINPSLD